MFQIFNIPRVNYSYYRPTIYRRRYIPVDSYLLNSIRQIQEYEKIKSILYNSMINQQRNTESLKSNIPEKQNENIDDNSNDNQEEKTQKPQQKEVSTKSPIYYFESHSHFDGEKMIEERKERKIDSEGKVHQKLQRRLGDQWYETEQIEDKEGQIENKETWHNVPENEIESFKEEWFTKTGQNKLGLTQNHNEQPELNEQEIEPKSEEQNDSKNEIKFDEQKDENEEEMKNENFIKDDSEKDEQVEQEIQAETESKLD